MNIEQKLKLLQNLDLKHHQMPKDDEIEARIAENLPNEKILFRVDLKKYSNSGWKLNRQIFLSSNHIINT